MTARWAEVIGAPIGHSLSPLIHGHWLAALGLSGKYRATRVEPGALPDFLAQRRADPAWRGCNITAPHKQAVLASLQRVEADAAEIGAVNCVYRDSGALAGANTDVDGICEALADLQLAGCRVAVIGRGGAARAAVRWLRTKGVDDIVLVVRRPEATSLPPARAVQVDEADGDIRSAQLVINATPLGLAGGESMPAAILGALGRSKGTAAFDMVYRPIDTPFLGAARAGGLRTVDGLTMLIGQARRSFRLLFGEDPPAGDDVKLRRLLHWKVASKRN